MLHKQQAERNSSMFIRLVFVLDIVLHSFGGGQRNTDGELKYVCYLYAVHK